jgi:2-dehydro-3-deoxyphosphogluconate aldolase/(4S)-4-hydroxy-2-oxoglutarate aldolase
MKRHEVRTRIEEAGILPSVRVNSRELARFAAETVYSAGIPVVEITMTTPGALEVIDDLARRYPDMAVGAGTVLDEEAARLCIEAGARFLTSPGFVPEVAAYANAVNVVVLPGALTPTEIIAAWKAGADLVKIFPTGHIGGVKYVRASANPIDCHRRSESVNGLRLYSGRSYRDWPGGRIVPQGGFALPSGRSHP